MSIKKKIQQSMTVILTVTLVLAYVILSVILYNRNMNLLQTEVKQEAAYIREAINLSDSDYMKQMDNVVESTRVTQIKADGTVLYDSRRDADILKNHGNRKEVREALSKGEGADVRKSETVGKDMYYYALLLNDGTVLRVSKSIDNLASTAVSLMPVMGILAVLTILFAFALARWQTNRLIKPINELDLERPLDSDIYEELSPLLEAMDRQNREKEAVANMRKEFSANVSHELKTPLTSMVGYIELIKREELSDIVRDYVDVISERAEKLKEMINSLFNLAKASSGNVELHPEPFEVNRMIEQIFADMDDRIKESHLEFVTDLTKEDTQLISDNSYFYRICQNLIENALKYSAKGTRVFVKTKLLQSEGKEEVWLEVTNTSGYPMDFTKEDIIERFARGDKARTGDGNGLGLAIVSTYAKALGGEFDILIDCDQFKACLKFPKKTI